MNRRGANQYRPNATAPNVHPDRSAAVTAAVAQIDIESAAWSFGPADFDATKMPPLDGTFENAVRWAAHPHLVARIRVASTSGCPPEILAILAEDHHSSVRRASIRNPGCPPSAIETFTIADTVDARACVENPNCPPSVLDRLARRRDGSEIASSVLAHPNLSADTVRWAVLEDGGELGFSQLLAHPHCPSEVLAAAEDDPVTDDYLAVTAISNPSCPLEAVEKATRSTRPNIAQAARSALAARTGTA